MTNARRLRLDPVERETGRPALIWWIAIAFVAIVMFTIVVPLETTLYGVHVAIAFGLGGLQCGSLLLAPVRPIIAIAAFTASTVGLRFFYSMTEWPWPWPVTAMILFALLVSLLTFYRGWRIGLLGYVVPALLVSAQLPPEGRLDAAMVNVIVAISIAGLAYLIVLLIAGRRVIAEQLLQERELSAAEQSKRLLAEERQRVARELHDVVAHSMSLIQVQATTARYRLAELEPRAAAEFDAIGASARQALTEMRRLLGVLRSEDDQAELAPQQGIDDIDALVGSASRAGVEISLSRGELPAQLPASVHIAAYRIAQEAISNAVRHAPGSSVAVNVDTVADAAGTGQAVQVTVVNSAPETPPGVSARGSGHGLIGMRERTALLGGRLEAGPTQGGGYRVSATLPVPADFEDAR